MDERIRAGVFVLTGYTYYGVRWWQNWVTGKVFRLGEIDLLPPSQYRHMLVCENWMQGDPVEPGAAPGVLLTESEVRQFIEWDIETLLDLHMQAAVELKKEEE